MFVSSLYPVKVDLCQADCCRLGGGAAAGREEESEEEDFASRRDLSIEDQGSGVLAMLRTLWRVVLAETSLEGTSRWGILLGELSKGGKPS